jgi:hypothetical protein
MESDSSGDYHVENPLGGKASPAAAVRASEAAALKADEQNVTGKSCISAYQFYWSVIKESPRTHKVFVTLVLVQAVWLVVSVSGGPPAPCAPGRCFALAQRLILISQLASASHVPRVEIWYLLLMFISGWFALSFAVEAVAKASAGELVAFGFVSAFLVIRDALG